MFCARCPIGFATTGSCCCDRHFLVLSLARYLTQLHQISPLPGNEPFRWSSESARPREARAPSWTTASSAPTPESSESFPTLPRRVLGGDGARGGGAREGKSRESGEVAVGEAAGGVGVVGAVVEGGAGGEGVNVRLKLVVSLRPFSLRILLFSVGLALPQEGVMKRAKRVVEQMRTGVLRAGTCVFL